MALLFCSRTGVLASSLAIALWLIPIVSHGQTGDRKNLDRLTTIVDQALTTSPEIQAAEAAVAAARAQLEGAVLPLNNPELKIDAERTDINTYSLGISQTLDWHNKQSAQQQVAQARLVAAKQSLQALQLTKATELLDAVSGVVTRRRINELVKQRSETLTRFAQLVRKRYAAGDIPQAELELARLSRVQAVMQEAQKRLS